MKIGISRRAINIVEGLQYFDYVETWDTPVVGQAYHIVRGTTVDPKHYLYVCNHMDWDYIPEAFAENAFGMTYKEVKKYLDERTGTKFLLDIGHAYIADICYEQVPFDIDKWLALNPEAVHLHNVEQTIHEVSGLPTYADHQLLTKGRLDMKTIIKKIENAGTKFLTVEVFMNGLNVENYSTKQLREELDSLL